MNDQESDSRKELVYVRPVADYPYSENDEISLIDLWLVLMKRKWMILGITALCVVLGAGYAWMQPVVYEYRTSIELARISKGSNSLELVSPRDENFVLLKNVIIPAQRKSLFKEEESKPRVEIEKQETDYSLMLKSAAEPQDADKVKKLHDAVAESLEEKQEPVLKKRIDIRVKPLKTRAKSLQDQIDTLEDQLQRLSARSHDLNSISSLIDAQQMGDIRRDIAQARVKLADAESAIETIQEASQPTRTSFVAAESEEPVGTGKALIGALSLVLGLMLGVFAAFFTEFLASASAAAEEKEK